MKSGRLGLRFWVGVLVSLLCLVFLFNNLDLAQLVENFGAGFTTLFWVGAGFFCGLSVYCGGQVAGFITAD